jgi:spore coat polysaccharide biosynthesis protein SpsF
VTGDVDYSGHRWTVDTPEDLEFVRAVYLRLKNARLKNVRLRDNPTFSWRDVFDLLEREPELMELNRSIMQKALHEG